MLKELTSSVSRSPAGRTPTNPRHAGVDQPLHLRPGRQRDVSDYVEDFWTTPGYLGTANSPLGRFFRAALVDTFATVASVQGRRHGT